jgi:amino acid transporter
LTQGFTAFMPWNVSDFFVDYISLFLFAALYGGHKLVYRQAFVKPIEADLDTGRKEIEEMHFEEVEPVGAWQKFWAWMG